MEVREAMPKGKDLRSFKPRKHAPADADLLKKASEMSANEAQMDQAQTLKKQMGQYEGKSEDELMRELLRVTREEKQKGKLDANSVANIKNSIWPMLNDQQRKKLLSILGKMENQ